MSLKRDIEAIYVLEPWYSKLRYEYETEGWVQDNVFWEQLKRSLDRLTQRVIRWLGPTVLGGVWRGGWPDLGSPKVDDWDFLYLTGLEVLAPDTIRLSYPCFPQKGEYGSYKNRLLYFVTLPILDFLKSVQSFGGAHYNGWTVTGPHVQRFLSGMDRLLRTERDERAKQMKFPYTGSAVQKVQRRQEKALQGFYGGAEGRELYGFSLLFAKAADYLNKASKSGSKIPERILAINVALNTAHRNWSVGGVIGLSKADLDRWSRMGVQSKATAKRYLESSVLDAIDLILDGVSPQRMAGSLVETMV